MAGFVGNPEDRFCRDEAQIYIAYFHAHNSCLGAQVKLSRSCRSTIYEFGSKQFFFRYSSRHFHDEIKLLKCVQISIDSLSEMISQYQIQDQVKSNNVHNFQVKIPLQIQKLPSLE